MTSKAFSILVMTALGFGIPILAAYCNLLCHWALHTPSARDSLLQWLYTQHGFQLAVALILIGMLKRIVPADYGLHLPRGRT